MRLLLDTQAVIWFLDGDPFDRLLVAQAIHEGFPIVGNDPAFDAYGVHRIW